MSSKRQPAKPACNAVVVGIVLSCPISSQLLGYLWEFRNVPQEWHNVLCDGATCGEHAKFHWVSCNQCEVRGTSAHEAAIVLSQHHPGISNCRYTCAVPTLDISSYQTTKALHTKGSTNAQSTLSIVSMDVLLTKYQTQDGVQHLVFKVCQKLSNPLYCNLPPTFNLGITI